MKSSLELQAERNRKARLRLVAENRERDEAIARFRDRRQGRRRGVRLDPEGLVYLPPAAPAEEVGGMPCCGAPFDAVASWKFVQRHKSGFMGLRPGRPCGAALACASLAAKEGPRWVEPDFGPAMDCCGAPVDVVVASSRYRARHKAGWKGREPSPVCVPAGRCSNYSARVSRRRGKK